MSETNANHYESYMDEIALPKVDLNESRIEFSVLNGLNYYVLPKMCEQMNECIGTHVLSEAKVRVIKIEENLKPIKEKKVDWYKRIIYNTMPQATIEWPIDLIEYTSSGGNQVLCYIFPLRAIPKWPSIKNILFQRKTSKVLDWRNREICNLCRSLLTSVKMFHDGGFAYNNFNMDRIFYNEKSMDIYFRFNFCIRSVDCKEGYDFVSIKKLAREFAPSSLYSEEYWQDTEKYQRKLFDKVDNYSITALIFRLMIGRLPYEGQDMSADGDVLNPERIMSEDEYDIYFKHYHHKPIFIFDPQNDRNALPLMSENDLPRERWNKLPEAIRKMFQDTFSCNEEIHCYLPEEWLQALNYWCWKEE